MEGVTPSHSFGGEIRRPEPAEKRGVYQLFHIYCLIEGSVSFFSFSATSRMKAFSSIFR